jgi:hypothetical protein
MQGQDTPTDLEKRIKQRCISSPVDSLKALKHLEASFQKKTTIMPSIPRTTEESGDIFLKTQEAPYIETLVTQEVLPTECVSPLPKPQVTLTNPRMLEELTQTLFSMQFEVDMSKQRVSNYQGELDMIMEADLLQWQSQIDEMLLVLENTRTMVANKLKDQRRQSDLQIRLLLKKWTNISKEIQVIVEDIAKSQLSNGLNTEHLTPSNPETLGQILRHKERATELQTEVTNLTRCHMQLYVADRNYLEDLKNTISKAQNSALKPKVFAVTSGRLATDFKTDLLTVPSEQDVLPLETKPEETMGSFRLTITDRGGPPS